MQIFLSKNGFLELKGKTNIGKVSLGFDLLDGKERKRAQSFDILIDGNLQKNGFLINSPGEYEIKGVFIKSDDGIHWKVKFEEIYFSFLKKIKKNILEKKEKFIDTEILCFKGENKESQESILKFIKEIQAKIVILLFFSQKRIEEFSKKLGIKRESQKKLKIKKEEILKKEEREIIFLEAN